MKIHPLSLFLLSVVAIPPAQAQNAPPLEEQRQRSGMEMREERQRSGVEMQRQRDVRPAIAHCANDAFDGRRGGPGHRISE